MIQYKVSGSLVQNQGEDKGKIRSFQEIFKENNPINARKKAFDFYKDILASIEESGEKIENKFTKGGDSFFDIGLGIGVYLEISDPFEKLWDNVNLVIEPPSGLGTSLEETIKDQIKDGNIENEDDYELYEGFYQWIILGIGNGIQANPFGFIDGLENEIVIYDYFNYDKENLETKILCFDGNNKRSTHKILKTPFDWDYNSKKLIKSTNVDGDTSQLRFYQSIIAAFGERKTIEFKPTLCYGINEKKQMDYIKKKIAVAIASFLNTDDGILFIGVDDKGEIIGLENDYNSLGNKNEREAFLKTFDKIISDYLGIEYQQNIEGTVFSDGILDFFVVKVKKSKYPVLVKNGPNDKEFYVRQHGGPYKLEVEDIIKWVIEKCKQGQ